MCQDFDTWGSGGRSILAARDFDAPPRARADPALALLRGEHRTIPLATLLISNSLDCAVHGNSCTAAATSARVFGQAGRKLANNNSSRVATTVLYGVFIVVQ